MIGTGTSSTVDVPQYVLLCRLGLRRHQGNGTISPERARDNEEGDVADPKAYM